MEFTTGIGSKKREEERKKKNERTLSEMNQNMKQLEPIRTSAEMNHAPKPSEPVTVYGRSTSSLSFNRLSEEERHEVQQMNDLEIKVDYENIKAANDESIKQEVEFILQAMEGRAGSPFQDHLTR